MVEPPATVRRARPGPFNCRMRETEVVAPIPHWGRGRVVAKDAIGSVYGSLTAAAPPRTPGKTLRQSTTNPSRESARDS